jgi:toxin ParE1/3/4
MAFKIIWTAHACEDLGALVRFIARHNPDAARAMGYGVYDRVQILNQNPKAGSCVQELGNSDWRQLVFRNYRIIYHINDEEKTVEIVRVWHGARGDVELPG